MTKQKSVSNAEDNRNYLIIAGKLENSPGPRTLYDKVFDDHIVYENDGNYLIYIDRYSFSNETPGTRSN
jgi:hypothetical protein